MLVNSLSDQNPEFELFISNDSLKNEETYNMEE